MQVVCEATQCNNEDIQVAALQNLVKIMSLYYVHMEAYMGPAIFAVSVLRFVLTGRVRWCVCVCVCACVCVRACGCQITLEAMKSDKNKVALQGVEFWSTVCDEEADLAIEASEAEESGRPPDQTSRFYVKGAMQYLVPILLLTMAKQVSGLLLAERGMMCGVCWIRCRMSWMMRMTGIPAKLLVSVYLWWPVAVKMPL